MHEYVHGHATGISALARARAAATVPLPVGSRYRNSVDFHSSRNCRASNFIRLHIFITGFQISKMSSLRGAGSRA
jgi:hypothetical protein